MRTVSLTLALAACIDADPALYAAEQAPLSVALPDLAVSQILPGQRARFTSAAVPPGARVLFLGSPNGVGSTCLPSGACVDLNEPVVVLASAQATRRGFATAVQQVPATLTPGTFGFQAVVIDAPGQWYLSETFERATGPGLCPAIYAPVCGLDGQNFGNSCEAEAAGWLYTTGPC